MIDDLEIIRNGKPMVEPITERSRTDLRQRLDDAIQREAPEKPPRRVRRRVISVLAGAVILAGSGGLIASLLPADHAGTPTAAHAVEVERQPDGTIRVTFVDVTDASAEEINAELAAADVRVRVHLVPGSPSLVGHVAAVWRRLPPDAVGGEDQLVLGNEFRGPFATGNRFRKLNGLDIDVPNDLLGTSLDVWVVRPAGNGEKYVVRRDSAERSDEALGCTTLYNLPAANAATILEDAGIQVIWQTSDTWNSHDLLMSYLAESVDDAPPFVTTKPALSDGDIAPLSPSHAGWHVWYTTPVAPGVVAVRIGPSAQVHPDAQPTTTIRGSRGVGLSVPVPDDSGSTASGFVRPSASAGSFRRFVLSASNDRYPKAGCDGVSLATSRVHVGRNSLSM